jgi:galactose-1-phosphate uridylyltransferase
MIKFDRFVAQAEFHNPMKGFQLDYQQIEHRSDPLTGQTSAVRTGREHWARFHETDEELLAKLVAESRERCIFCPENAEYTPRFPAEFIPEGRVNLGEARLFPNLFAQKEYSAIVILSPRHFLRLDEFTPQILYGGFKAAAFYFDKVYRLKSARYAEIGFNYLPPAGSSVLHAHLQVLVSHRPHYLLKELSEHAQEHYEANAVNYWDDLIETERKTGERYLGSLGNTEWYVPFAPMKNNEVRAVVRDKSNFMEFDDTDWENMADGVSRVLRSYHDKGLVSLNLALYSGPLGEKQDHLWAGLRMISRPGINAYNVSDCWFSFSLNSDGAVSELPEELASSLRGYFR